MQFRMLMFHAGADVVLPWRVTAEPGFVGQGRQMPFVKQIDMAREVSHSPVVAEDSPAQSGGVGVFQIEDTAGVEACRIQRKMARGSQHMLDDWMAVNASKCSPPRTLDRALRVHADMPSVEGSAASARSNATSLAYRPRGTLLVAGSTARDARARADIEDARTATQLRQHRPHSAGIEHPILDRGRERRRIGTRTPDWSSR